VDASHDKQSTAIRLTRGPVPAPIHRLDDRAAETAVLLEVDNALDDIVVRRAVVRHGGLLQNQGLGGGLACEAGGVDGGGINRDLRRVVVEVEGHVDWG
jgi:hypothetical protein